MPMTILEITRNLLLKLAALNKCCVDGFFCKNRNFLKYLMVGALNTGLTYGLYLILLNFLSYRIAYTLAYVAGILSSYLLNSFFVFNVKVSYGKFFLYPVVYLVHYFFSLLLLMFLVGEGGIGEMVAPVIVIFFGVPLTYGLSKIILAR